MKNQSSLHLTFAVCCCCCCCWCYRRRQRMILRSARAARRSRTSSSFVWPRSLLCFLTKSARHLNHNCSADSASSPNNQQTASSEFPAKCCQRLRSGFKRCFQLNILKFAGGGSWLPRCPDCSWIYKHATHNRDVDLTTVRSVPFPSCASMARRRLKRPDLDWQVS